MRIAAAQTSPRWGDAQATTKIVIDWIGRAAEEGVELLAFGETFLSGYPFWVSVTDGARFNDAAQKEAFAFYLDSAVAIDGPELREIVSAVRDHRVFTYLGITERSQSRGTVYCTAVAIDPDRGIVGSHRKMMPTYEERLVWGVGDGNGLRVHEVGGSRVSALNCWENWIPLARHALYAQGIDLHVALWPGGSDLTRDITRFIAREGRCYVLSAGATLRASMVNENFPLRELALVDDDLPYDGGSAIAAPNGSWVVEPVSGDERLVMADIDPTFVRRERHNFDPAGHYLRADVLQLTVNRRRLDPATFQD
jgi:nitrilase